MTKTKIHRGDWVIVCDGRKALILENLGDAKFPNLRMKEVREHEDSPTSKLGTDAPGRVHQSFGTARSSVEQTDWHDNAERHFLGELVRHLDILLSSDSKKRLIMVASPRALGMLRQVYSPAVRNSIAIELGKDLVKMPIDEIERQLTD